MDVWISAKACIIKRELIFKIIGNKQELTPTFSSYELTLNFFILIN